MHRASGSIASPFRIPSRRALRWTNFSHCLWAVSIPALGPVNFVNNKFCLYRFVIPQNGTTSYEANDSRDLVDRNASGTSCRQTTSPLGMVASNLIAWCKCFRKKKQSLDAIRANTTLDRTPVCQWLWLAWCPTKCCTAELTRQPLRALLESISHTSSNILRSAMHCIILHHHSLVFGLSSNPSSKKVSVDHHPWSRKGCGKKHHLVLLGCIVPFLLLKWRCGVISCSVGKLGT